MTTQAGNNRTRLKTWLVVLGVFVLGCVTGAALSGAAYRMYAGERGGGEQQEGRRGGRGGGKRDMFERMRRDLNLSEQQAGEVRAILDQTRDEYRSLRGEFRPRYDASRAKARERIRALLTPEQQQIFDAKTAERDARRREREEENKE